MRDAKILIVPDVHHDIDAVRRVLAAEEDADEVVFLGDWFDNFGDTPEEAGRTAEYLASLLSQAPENDNYVFLLGNHDAPYMNNDNGAVSCSGFNMDKAERVNEHMSPHHWKKFRLFYEIDNWLLSHAGMTGNLSAYYRVYKDKDGELEWELSKERLYNLQNEALYMLGAGYTHWMIEPGMSRGGMQNFGGVTWCDWDVDFSPIPGFNQVCGHTRHPTVVRTKHTKNSKNWCIDTGMQHYALLEGDELTVKEVPEEEDESLVLKTHLTDEGYLDDGRYHAFRND